MKESVAVIGGGIAGLTAAYLLNEKYDVSLFEKSETLGGNAYTYKSRNGEEFDLAVMAHLKRNYRNFSKLIARLKLETVSGFGTSVSFLDLDTNEGLYVTPGITGLLAQRFALLKPKNLSRFLRLLQGLKKGMQLLETGELEGLTLKESLEKIPEIGGEGKLLFIGTLCVISSMDCDNVMDSPAPFFFSKLKAYDDLLPPKGLILMRYMKNKTRSYVDALSEGFRNNVVLRSDIQTVIRENDRVILQMKNGEKRTFDKVVFACNADQALQLLEKPTISERELLSAWRYTEAEIVVHSDGSSLPKRPLMPGYTLAYRPGGRYIQSSVNFPLWRLPGASKDCKLMITQHQNFPIQADLREFGRVFRTPIYDFKSYATIGRLPSLNGVKNSYYCGAHFGFGLHEDAVSSAVAVARDLGIDFR